MCAEHALERLVVFFIAVRCGLLLSMSSNCQRCISSASQQKDYRRQEWITYGCIAAHNDVDGDDKIMKSGPDNHRAEVVEHFTIQYGSIGESYAAVCTARFCPLLNGFCQSEMFNVRSMVTSKKKVTHRYRYSQILNYVWPIVK